jgi:hypothetical protein
MKSFVNPNGKGREAAYAAIEHDKRRPIALDPGPHGLVDPASETHVPNTSTNADSWRAPPPVLKPSRGNDQVCAPMPDLEGHRAALKKSLLHHAETLFSAARNANGSAR